VDERKEKGPGPTQVVKRPGKRMQAEALRDRAEEATAKRGQSWEKNPEERCSEAAQAQRASLRDRTRLYAACGFVILWACLVLNEVLDVPHLLTGSARTPTNWGKLVVESLCAVAVGAFVLMIVGRVTQEHRKLLEKLSESDQRYRSFIERFEGIAYEIRVSGEGFGKFVFFGGRVEEMTGYKAKDFINGRIKWEQLIHPEDATRVEQEKKNRLFGAEQASDCEYRIVHRDGSHRWVREMARVQRAEVQVIRGVVYDISEQKHAKEILEESEELYRTLFESANDAIFLMDFDRFIDCNPKTLEMFACKREQIVGGRPYSQYFSPPRQPDGKQSKEKAMEKIRAVLDGTPQFFEWRHRRAGGKEFDTEVSLNRIELPGRRYILAVVRDVTARKQVEKALRASEEKYSKLFHHSNDSIFLHDLEGQILDVNERALEQFGYSREEMLSLRIEQLHPPEAIVGSRKALEEIQHYGFISFDIHFRKKNGEVFPAEVSASLFELSGKPVIQGIVRDISERKRSQEAIARSESILRTIIQSAQEAIISIREDGRIWLFNPAAEKMFGWRREEMLGEPLDRLIPEQYRQRHREYVARYFATGKFNRATGRTLELPGLRRDGQVFPMAMSLSAGQIGEERFVVAVARDISEQKQAQQKLLEDQAQLKSMASALSLAEERERHRLATELHDEISQPLVISKIKLDTVLRSVQDPNLREQLQSVSESLERTIAQTRSLTFDLSSPILYELGFEAAVAEWLREIAQKHGIKTAFEDDGQPKPLEEDIKVLLFRNVRELLMNVVKHARASEAKVRLWRAGGNINVLVEDNGVGFEAEQVILQHGGKAGFGLFSVRQRLEQLGGSIHIESAAGQGCRVTMTAPLKLR